MNPTIEAWPRCPEAAAFFEKQCRDFAGVNPPLAAFAAQLHSHAGVLLTQLVDHWTLPDTPELRLRLANLGLEAVPTTDGATAWKHPGARLPRVRLETGLTAPRLALHVEDVDAFARANALTPTLHAGDPDAAYEEARFTLLHGELAAVARRGYDGFTPGTVSPDLRATLADARVRLDARPRDGDEIEIIASARALLSELNDSLGVNRATDEFFASERRYYMGRNRAAAWQFARQQTLGIGWGNHDHHTYRSSRRAFRALMGLWDALGFTFREKFYAGAEAGWGAQVIEHPVSRVVIFADVDMSPEELGVDYLHEDLPERDALGTIGLWCALHGSSVARAGMHHLEAEFDFAHVRSNLMEGGHGVMPPFTDLPMLKQAFTEPELWQVGPEPLAALCERGAITSDQASYFAERGAAGSHLEILQRWEGFKGFNKTGVSAIIRATDARHAIPA